MLHIALSILSYLSTPVFPGQCEELISVPGKTGPRLQRVRKPHSREEVVRTIHAVAKEMGADPQLLLAIAQHESHMQPAALHVLPEDRKAGLSAWRLSTYSKEREDRFLKIQAAGPSHRKFYPAKLGLWRMERYKGNPYWDAKTTVGNEEINTWTWGYGLYGMAPVLYVGLWDSQSPPWILCDAKVATVTLVWALRAQRAQCAALGEEGTVEQTVARYATGHCGQRVKANWKGVLRKTKKVQLGTRWKMKDADRSALLQAIQRKLEVPNG